jgi:hypothetical protein
MSHFIGISASSSNMISITLWLFNVAKENMFLVIHILFIISIYIYVYVGPFFSIAMLNNQRVEPHL